MLPPTDPRELPRKISLAEDIRNGVLNYIDGRRRAPADILKHLLRGTSVTRSMVKDAIGELVAAGELAYSFEHGATFLEPSFDRPVRVGECIVLSPPGKAFHPEPGDLIVRIMAGASFGAGRHATTRLALRGIEFALRREGSLLLRPGSRMLDIGTGTGVLAIAAVLLGIESGLGVDIDPCAVSEAKENIRLNGLEKEIEISTQAVEDVEPAFILIAANLRPPTLVRLSAKIAALAESSSALVLSGMRTHEDEGILSTYEDLGFTCVWRGEEDEWAAAAFRKDS